MWQHLRLHLLCLLHLPLLFPGEKKNTQNVSLTNSVHQNVNLGVIYIKSNVFSLLENSMFLLVVTSQTSGCTHDRNNSPSPIQHLSYIWNP